MIHRVTERTTMTVLAAAWIFSTVAWAQPPAAPPQQPPPTPPAPTTTVLESNPAILAALQWPRERPADALRAVLALVDLGRPELARPIVEELLARNLTAAERASLVAEFGSHRMMQLSRLEQLAPAAGAFAQACMEAAAAAAIDPQRLTRLVEQLQVPRPEQRQAAAADLAAAGDAGVIAVLESLGRDAEPTRRAALAAALRRMRPLVDGPLVAMLETSDAALRADVARLLVALGVTQAAPLLVADAGTAEHALRYALDQLRRGAPLPFATDADDQVTLWRWDDATKSLFATRYPADEARVLWMAPLAERLAGLRPENLEYQRQALVLGLEAAGIATGQPGRAGSIAMGRLTAADAAFVNRVLADALQSNHARAAIAAINELARRGDARVLLTPDGCPAPLADALAHGNRRVRFAALAAIMALDPATPFPGSTRATDSLAFFARGAGRRSGLVAMPTLAAATDLAGTLAAAGLEGEATNRGSDVAKRASQMSDLEVVLVDMDIIASDIRQVLYELRILPTTKHVPVAILAADGRLVVAERLAAEHDRVLAFARPHTQDSVRYIVDRLLGMNGRDAVTPAERAGQATQAVGWTAGLLERRRTFYGLRREERAVAAALFQADAPAPAITALARLGTPLGQQALVTYASQPSLPIEGRRQAAAAFNASIQAHGLLLTRDEILNQYDLYNASAAADAETQQVLSALLDAMERKIGE